MKSVSAKLFEELMKGEARNADQKKMIRNLEIQYDFILKILDTTVEFVNVFDMKLNFLTVNKKSELAIGLSRDEIIGKNFKTLFPGSLKTIYYKNMQAAAQGYSVQHSESVAPSGKFYITSFLPLSEHNVQYAVLVVSRDITEHVLREKQLKEMNADLKNKNKALLKISDALKANPEGIEKKLKKKLQDFLPDIK